MSLSSITLSFSDLDYLLHFCVCASYSWPWFVFFVLIPSFQILFSIFSTLLCSFSICIVSAFFCRSIPRLLSFSLIFFVYSLRLSSIHLSSIIAHQMHLTWVLAFTTWPHLPRQWKWELTILNIWTFHWISLPNTVDLSCSLHNPIPIAEMIKWAVTSLYYLDIIILHYLYSTKYTWVPAFTIQPQLLRPSKWGIEIQYKFDIYVHG